MRTRQAAALVGVGCLLVAGLALAGAAAGADTAADDPEVNVSVENGSPWTNETFDVTVSFRNTLENRHALEEVTLTDGAGTTLERQRFTNAELRRGEARTLVFEDVRLDEPGLYDLTARVTLRDEFNAAVGEAQRTVEVARPGPIVDVSTDGAVAATERTVSVGLSNPRDEPIRGVQASLSAGPDANFTVTDGDGAVPVVGALETRELEFTVRGAPAGTYELPLTLRFETADGSVWERSRTVTAEFAEPATVDLADVSVGSHPNGVAVEGSVFTAGDKTVTNVRVEPVDTAGVGPTRPTPRAFVGSLSGNGSVAFELTASLAADRERVPLRIRYRSAGTLQTTTVTVPYDGPRDRDPVELTGVRLSGSSLRADVANTGGSDVAGVTVAVADAEGVTRTDEFFVGSVESGRFEPIGGGGLSFGLADGRETIPVQISYTLDGTQYRTTTEVDTGGAAATGGGATGGSGDTGAGDSQSTPEFDPGDDGGDDGGGGLPVVGGVSPLALLGVVAVGALALVGGVVYRRRAA